MTPPPEPMPDYSGIIGKLRALKNLTAFQSAVALALAALLVGGFIVGFKTNGEGTGGVTPTTSTVPPTTSTAPPPTTSTTPPTTTTPVTTTTTQPPSTKPSAANTGVPAGTVLSPVTGFTASSAGQTFDRLDVNGTVTIAANDVTINRSRIKGYGFHVLYILDGVTGFTISDSEIDGLGVNGSDGSDGIFGAFVGTRLNIHGVENGAQMSTGSSITASYIHDLAAPGAPHYDGLEIDGARSNIVIRGNTIISNPFQTSSVMIDNYFGPTKNVTVDKNWLYGGGYILYVDSRQGTAPITGIIVTSNRFGLTGCTTTDPPCAQWGYSVVTTAITQSGNVSDVTGQPITL